MPLLLALYLGFMVLSALPPARAATPAAHTMTVTLISGQTVTVPLPIVDRHRPYVLTIALVGERQTGDENFVTVELEDVPAILPAPIVTRAAPSAATEITAFRENPRLRLSAAGEIG